jgi:ornithine cyclodeaminase
MVALGAVIAGDAAGRRSPDEVTLFCSVGLAGTEVFLLDALAG